MENNILKKISRQIVDKRVIIMIAFLAACVYCALSISRVHVNNDITSFLPPDTDTRRGLTIMENEFTTYASANVMLANTTYERASAAAEKIETLEHVTGVTFDNSPAHFVDSAALLTISFDGTSDDENVIAAMNEIRSLTAGFDTYTSSDIGADLLGEIAQQMVGVVALAAVVIMAVLLFTSRSYFEVVIFLIVFSVAALLNMGTNFWLGEISSITNSIAVILQLALAIDYAIIFSHRYQDEIDRFPTEREALIEALSKSIVEISSSSLTTISGLVALMLMQFRLGYDLGLVLSKGILCSLITVFLLMPGLIASFFRPLRRTTHKSHVPDITGWGRFLMKTRFGFVAVFVIILPLAIWCSSRTEYAFNDAGIDELKYSESRAAARKITGTFANDTTIAVLVPSGNYEAEKQFLRDAAELDNVKTVTGLANIEIEDGKVLTDSYTPRMFSMLLNIDFEEAEMLYAAYGVENGQYQPIFGNAETYSVPLIDMFLFLFEKIDQGIVTLDADSQETLDSLRGELERGEAQLRGENWDRMVITADVPIEGDESVALVNALRSLADGRYGEGACLVIGDVTSAKELADTFNGDSLLINLLTIAFVFFILIFTFRSVVGAALLVFVIQGSIWINFTFPYLTHTRASFVTNMIVSAIQMGATIDYAIVIMSRYLDLKKLHPPQEAMAQAVNESFPTVMTSGTIMTVAGILIAYRVSDVYIGHIGLAVGRGALISVILVLSVLPQLIVLLDKVIEKTTFRKKTKTEVPWNERWIAALLRAVLLLSVSGAALAADLIPLRYPLPRISRSFPRCARRTHGRKGRRSCSRARHQSHRLRIFRPSCCCPERLTAAATAYSAYPLTATPSTQGLFRMVLKTGVVKISRSPAPSARPETAKTSAVSPG